MNTKAVRKQHNTAERVLWNKYGSTAYKEWISWIVLATTQQMIELPQQ